MLTEFYQAFVKTLYKVVMDLWIAIKAFVFFIAFLFYLPFSMINTDKYVCGREVLKMFLTFVMYVILIPLDLTAILFFPAMLMVKGFETPYRVILDLFGVIPSEQRRMEDTRFRIYVYNREIVVGEHVFSLTCKRAMETFLKALEKIAMYSCSFYLLCFMV